MLGAGPRLFRHERRDEGAVAISTSGDSAVVTQVEADDAVAVSIDIGPTKEQGQLQERTALLGPGTEKRWG